MLGRNEVIREYFRLCDLVNRVEEETDLLDADEAQAMRARYSERAEVVLDHYREERRKAERVGAVQ